MSDVKQTYVVFENGKHTLKDFPGGTRPSNFVSLAPNGMREGMDDLLIIDFKNNTFSVDEKLLSKRLEDKQWDDSSFLQRVRSKIIG